MTDYLHHSLSSDQSSSPNMAQAMAQGYDPSAVEVADSLDQQLDLSLDIQALQILHSSDDCIKVLDLEGRILFMSRGGQLLLDIQDLTPFLNTSWIEFWQGAAQQAVSEAIAQAKTGQVCTFQGYFPTMSGEPKWWDIKISPIREADGQIERLLCISRDITEHKQMEDQRQQAEEKLRESEQRYRAIINQAVTGVACTDLDGNLTLVNQKYCEITGYSADELIQLRMQDITHTNDLSQNIELFHRMRTEGTPFEIEKRYIRKDGSIVWVNNSVSVIRDRDGNPQSTVAIVLDITERKRREAHAAFLAEIGEDFSRLSTANDIMQTVGAKLGAYLQITTCNFTDVDENQDQVTVYHGWSSPEVPSTVGTFRLSQYLSKEFERASRAGETVVICNTQDDPRTDATGYAALNMHSFVTVPFHRDGRWTHYIAICDSRPRNWREDEIQLIEEISNRIFPRLQRARTEETLRESEAKYRSLFESIDEGFCLIEILFDECGQAFDYRFLEANPALEKHTGLVDVVGKTMRELTPQIETSWFETYGRIVQTGVPERFENTAQELGRFYDVYAFRMGEPEERKVAVLFTDITDRKLAEAAIAADLRDTQLLHDLSARLVSEGDIQALYQEIVSAAMTLTQADAGSIQALDESTQELVLIATQGIEQIVTDHFQRVTAGSVTSCGIVLMTGKRAFVNFDVPESEDPDGSLRLHFKTGLICAQSTPLVSRSGKRIGMVSTHWRKHYQPSDRELRFLDLLARQAADLIEQRQDEAQRKQLLEREQAAREAAEQANRIKDEFLAVLSHELRSPLNPILGWSTLLLNNKLDATKTTQALTTIQRNAKLQSELIEDLLDISRILRGKLSLNIASVNLTTVIRGALETVRLAADAKFIQIEANLTEEVSLVSGDSTRLQQVVWNLLSNAVKFTSPGGKVSIRLERLNSSAQITVSDTGQGITPDFLPYVFDYFRQADGATTRKFGGLGLGLAIVRHLVELHGGTVQAQSQGEGLGATFSVQLPLIPTLPTQDSTLNPPSSTPHLTGVQVLVVDDDADSRDFIAFVLEQGGAQVRTATSAVEALSLLRQFQPDVLISDIGMPDRDGYMLMQQVRALPAEQGGKIAAIALTAYVRDFDQQRALQAGFQSHLSKPVEPEALLQALFRLSQQDRGNLG